MKAFSLIIILMIGSSILNARTIIDPTFIENNLKNQALLVVHVSGKINLPDNPIVGVEFELLESGKIKVTSISGNPALAEYVRSRIENIETIHINIAVGEKFNYDVVFRRDSDV